MATPDRSDIIAWKANWRFDQKTNGQNEEVTAEDADKAWETIQRRVIDAGWYSIETAPLDGRFVLVCGESGYTSTPWRVEVCRYEDSYQPGHRWRNHAHDSFRDGGGMPLGWRPLPSVELECTELLTTEQRVDRMMHDSRMSGTSRPVLMRMEQLVGLMADDVCASINRHVVDETRTGGKLPYMAQQMLESLVRVLTMRI